MVKQKEIVEVHTAFNIGSITFVTLALNREHIKYKIVTDNPRRNISYPYLIYSGKIRCIKLLINKKRSGTL